jgi:hypothetical protein
MGTEVFVIDTTVGALLIIKDPIFMEMKTGTFIWQDRGLEDKYA